MCVGDTKGMRAWLRCTWQYMASLPQGTNVQRMLALVAHTPHLNAVCVIQFTVQILAQCMLLQSNGCVTHVVLCTILHSIHGDPAIIGMARSSGFKIPCKSGLQGISLQHRRLTLRKGCHCHRP
jgi:hypothetical protein